jgi:hypothetical protein
MLKDFQSVQNGSGDRLATQINKPRQGIDSAETGNCGRYREAQRRSWLRRDEMHAYFILSHYIYSFYNVIITV